MANKLANYANAYKKLCDLFIKKINTHKQSFPFPLPLCALPFLIVVVNSSAKLFIALNENQIQKSEKKRKENRFTWEALALM